jgi:hypothetical protein
MPPAEGIVKKTKSQGTTLFQEITDFDQLLCIDLNTIFISKSHYYDK